MIGEQEIYMIIGSGTQILLFLTYKQLRDLKKYSLILIFTIGLAIIGYLNLDKPTLQMARGSAADWLFFPLLFMITFRIARYMFLRIFNNEPLMTGYMQMSWNQGEYRRLHFGDAIFTITCLLLPMIIMLTIE